MRSRRRSRRPFFAVAVSAALLVALASGDGVAAGNVVKIGLNYPKTGPYSVEGLDQLRAAELAVSEINAAGGILGRKIALAIRDSRSRADVTTQNVTELVDKEGVRMVFGGAASSVAIAAGRVCQEKGVPFFGTLTYSTETTGIDGHRHTFRECYDAWMGAKVIADYLKKTFPGKRYFYVTADYTWGWTTEDSVRRLTGTADKKIHKGLLTPFPTAQDEDFRRALDVARIVKPDVLVLVLFGKDMVAAARIAASMGMKKEMQIVVPNITLGMAEGAGPKVMEGVLGALPWDWIIPFKYGYARGKDFVEKFAARYKRYPSTSGASAYTILYEYKSAVERAKSFESPAVIKALEGHAYQLLKDRQTWRAFDHQSVQTVYAVRCRPEGAVLKDRFRLGYFEVIASMRGEDAAVTFEEWRATRAAAGKPGMLERLPGE